MKGTVDPRATEGTAAAAGAATGATGATGAGGLAAAYSTSAATIRPEGPEPATVRRST